MRSVQRRTVRKYKDDYNVCFFFSNIEILSWHSKLLTCDQETKTLFRRHRTAKVKETKNGLELDKKNPER